MADDIVVTVDDSPSVTPALRVVYSDTSCIDLTHDDDDTPQEPPRRRPRLSANSNQANIELVDLTQTPPTVPADIRNHFPVVEERSARYAGRRMQWDPSIDGGNSLFAAIVRRSPRKRKNNAATSMNDAGTSGASTASAPVAPSDGAGTSVIRTSVNPTSMIPTSVIGTSMIPTSVIPVSVSPAPSENSNESLPSVSHIVQSVVDKNKKLAEEEAMKKGPLTPQKQIACPICFDDIEQLRADGRHLMSGNCGHVYCGDCIKAHLKIQPFCPQCRKKLTMKSIHPLYL